MINMTKFTTAISTIVALQHIFKTYGLPELVVSDNSLLFTYEVSTKFW